MIGKKLSERQGLGAIAEDQAVAMVKATLASHASLIVKVRAADARMIACLVVRADKATLRLCRALGFRTALGATAVFGLLGADAARIFERLPAGQRAWLEAPCGPRETKVLLLSGGIALLSVETTQGQVTVTALPALDGP